MPENKDIVTNEKILVALTIDTDSDDYFGNRYASISKQDKSILGWEGLDIGKNLLVSAVEEVSKRNNIPIPLTWFVRCDNQIGVQNGDPAYLLQTHKKWWQQRQQQGDDIQWHAHLYRQAGNLWRQETSPMQLEKDLKTGLKAFENSGFSPSIIRIGESYHSNELMDIIVELGVKADSTAMPGRKRQDQEKLIDWLSTPNTPYQPSKKDYRLSGEKRRSLWELPLNTVMTKVSYDQKPVPRYVNLAFQPGVLESGLTEFFKKHNTLVSITHPFEVVNKFYSDSQSPNHPLLSFRPDSLVHNMEMIFGIAQSLQKEVEFVTMSQLLEML
jgi:hypothetical protein